MCPCGFLPKKKTSKKSVVPTYSSNLSPYCLLRRSSRHPLGRHTKAFFSELETKVFFLKQIRFTSLVLETHLVNDKHPFAPSSASNSEQKV